MPYDDEIRNVIQEFVDFCSQPKGDGDDKLAALLLHLDKLVLLRDKVNFTFDNKDYTDPPKKDFPKTRAYIEAKFPEIIELEDPTVESVSQDPIDDLVDIYADMKDMMWYYENTSDDDALWHYDFGYKNHWGSHVRNLQHILHNALYWGE